MGKSCLKMDLDDWEVLPDNKSFLDFSHDNRKDVLLKDIIVDMDYFICPSHSLIEEENSGCSKEALTPLGSDSMVEDTDGALDQEFKDIGVVTPVILVNHRDVVSQVFFKTLKENKLVDMKMDYPKSNSKRAIMPHLEPDHVQFDEDMEEARKLSLTENSPFKEEETEKEHTGSGIKSKAFWDGFGFTLWNWKLSVIGAFCSMGAAAAATICIFIFGGRQQQNQKIQFKIYTNDKRMKEVVQQATRLNQALSSVRGAPMTRASISFGGYYTSV